MSEEKKPIDLIVEKLIDFDSSEVAVVSVDATSSDTHVVALRLCPKTGRYIGSLSAQANALVFDVAKALELTNVQSDPVVVVDEKPSVMMSAQLKI